MLRNLFDENTSKIPDVMSWPDVRGILMSWKYTFIFAFSLTFLNRFQKHILDPRHIEF